MKRDLIDFFVVESHQHDMHDRLINWALWLKPNQHGGDVTPMFRQAQSNSRQWHAPESTRKVGPLDGLAIERAVRALPEPHAYALRWSYYYRTSPMKARRALGVTNEGLMRLVRDARQMLINRRV